MAEQHPRAAGIREEVLSNLPGVCRTDDCRDRARAELDRFERASGNIPYAWEGWRGRMNAMSPERRLPVLKAELEETRKRGNAAELWQHFSMLAEASSQTGDPASALAYQNEALHILRRRSEYQLAAELNHRGLLATDYGDVPEAERALEEELTFARQHRFQRAEASALGALGYRASDRGDYLGAIRYVEQSVAVLKALGLNWQAGAGLGNIAIVYMGLGEYGLARRYILESYRSALEQKDSAEILRTLTILADLALRAGDLKDARLKLDEAVALGKMNNLNPVQFNIMSLLGDVERKSGRLQQAVAQREAPLKLARNAGSRYGEAQSLIELGHCRADLAQWDQAEHSYREALAIVEPPGFAESIVEVRQGLARIERARGRPDAALDHLREAMRRIETTRGRIPSPEMQSSLTHRTVDIYRNAIDILAAQGSAARNSSGSALHAEAFGISERSRARSFLDLLAETKVRSSRDLSSEQVRQETLLNRTLSQAMTDQLAKDTPETRRAVDQAEHKLEQWRVAARANDEAHDRLQNPVPATAAEAMNLARDAHAAIVAYWLGPKVSHAWVIRAGSLRMYSLPLSRARIERQTAKLRDALATPPGKGSASSAGPGYEQPARALYEALIRPLARNLGSAHDLIIIPDGALHYLPFGTLLDGNGHHLIEQFNVAYAPSVSVYRDLRRSSAAPATPMELLAFGDPRFSLAQTAPAPVGTAVPLVRRAYAGSALKLNALPNTRKEVAAIASLYPKAQRTAYLGEEASETRLKSTALSDYRRLHLATHALIDERAPNRSAIVLSLVNTGREDGLLRIGGVFSLRLNADLVVLSACSTGRGKLVTGEGMVGLTRAFFHAGAARVVVSLWDVNDVATVDLMRAFYVFMKEGKRPSEALRAAKLGMIRSEVPAYRHPYYWAVFIANGLL
jgi:CHAT domain-containing protein